MRRRFFRTAFTPSVQAEQAKHGSQAAYIRMAAGGDADEEGMTASEIDFITSRDSFYLATVSETGWPHVQHRGGAVGFIKVLDERTFAWADFSGNRQYVSVGNTAVNDKVATIFMDYPAQRRLKVLGRMVTEEIADRPDLRTRLEVEGYGGKIEHAIIVHVEAFDWNCPQHITPRYTAEEIEMAVAPLRRQIADLKGRPQAAADAGVQIRDEQR